MLYYDANQNCFFDNEIHGTRKISVPDPSWERPLVDVGGEMVPDESALPPVVEVNNPICTLPTSAIPVPYEIWQGALEAQSNGLPFVAGIDGLPTWPPTAIHSYVDGVWKEDANKKLAAKKSIADAEVSAGLQDAARQIGVLQDAVELGMATPAESEAYTAWRRYRVLLSRVQSDPAYPDVALPEQPSKVVL